MMIGLVVHMTGFTRVYQQPPAPGSWGTGTSCDRLTGGGGLPMPSLQAHTVDPSSSLTGSLPSARPACPRCPLHCPEARCNPPPPVCPISWALISEP